MKATRPEIEQTFLDLTSRSVAVANRIGSNRRENRERGLGLVVITHNLIKSGAEGGTPSYCIRNVIAHLPASVVVLSVRTNFDDLSDSPYVSAFRGKAGRATLAMCTNGNKRQFGKVTEAINSTPADGRPDGTDSKLGFEVPTYPPEGYDASGTAQIINENVSALEAVIKGDISMPDAMRELRVASIDRFSGNKIPY